MGGDNLSILIETEVLRLADNLSNGEVRRMICPTCAGGQSGEISFGVGREPDRIWWNCFRASCSERGMTSSHTIAPAERSIRLDRVKPYWKAAVPLGTLDYDYFRLRFDITHSTADGNIYVTDVDEYLLPYRSPTGTKRGYVVRQPSWTGKPTPVRKGYYASKHIKARIYPHTTEPVMAWYKAIPPSHADVPEGSWVLGHLDRVRGQLVVVEDQISAMRVAQAGIDCVALLGCGVNAEKARDIAREKYKTVTLALDPDAQDIAQTIRRTWGGYWNRTRLVTLEADPKDVPYDTLLEELAL